MDIVIEDGTIKREISTIIHKFSDSTKKDITSETTTNTIIIFKDKNGTVYPNGKIVKSDELVILYDYEYTKDKNGNILRCKITTSKMKNGKSIDIEKTTSVKYYDEHGKLIVEEFFTSPYQRTSLA